MTPNKSFFKIAQHVFFMSILLSTLMLAQDGQAKKVIYETNMCATVDDVGALAVIHGLQNRGEAELLAVCLNATGDPDGAAVIDAINTWYGRGNIPVGIWKGPFPDPDTSKYMHALTRFPLDIDSKSAPSALEIYRKVLSKQADKSVMIISTGYLQNLDELLRNEPELVAAKVQELVIMGAYQNDPEHFVLHDTKKAAQNVIQNWPTPLVFHLLGEGIMTGSGLKDTPEENPVRMAYYLQLGPDFPGNASWDQMTVLYAVRGCAGYFKRISSGKGKLLNGYKWKLKTRHDSYLEALLPAESYAKIIEELMLEAPRWQPKKVIYDTDMCADVDDVGALAMLHAMANMHEVELLAVCFNEVHPYGAPAIDAINTWYGRGDIPVGIFKSTLENPHDSRYLESVAQFPHDLERATAQSTLEVYQEILRDQPDGSVTIISVGFVNNLAELLQTDPELVKAKVKELVLMAGTTDGGGFNMNQHNLSSVSEYVIREWPTPIVFTDPGGTIYTGPGLKDAPVENPVREAYYKYFNNDFKNRPSWDQITVLYGVRGLADYFSMGTTGTGHLQNGFVYQIKSGHRTFVKPLLTDEAYAEIIQNLMLQPPLQ